MPVGMIDGAAALTAAHMAELDALSAIFEGAAVPTADGRVLLAVPVEAPPSAPVEHVEPLRLVLELPLGYPDEERPRVVTASAAWAAADAAALVDARLGELFVAGGEVLFELLTTLEDEAWGLLYDADGCDGAAMVAFSAAEGERRFMAGKHECGVCLEEDLPGSEVVRLPCGHVFCRPCLGRYCSESIQGRELHKLVCPIPGCKVELAPGMVRELVDPDVGNTYEAVSLEKALELMEDVVYCPRTKCGGIALVDGTLAQCVTCHGAFCTDCHQAWHPGACQTAALRESSRSSQSSQSSQSSATSELQRTADEMASVEFMRRFSQRCNRCGNAVIKNGGCSSVRCRCGSVLTWHIDHMTTSLIEQGVASVTLPGSSTEGVVPTTARSVKCPAHERCGGKGMKESSQHPNWTNCNRCRRMFCFRCLKTLTTETIKTHFGGGPGQCPVVSDRASDQLAQRRAKKLAEHIAHNQARKVHL